jgi:hypothetical protein
MTQDETDRPRGASSYRPDPAFIERLENDSLWQEDASRAVRRTDRYADRRTDRRTTRAHDRNDFAPGRKPGSKRAAPRSRLIAVIVLVLAALVLLIAGLQISDSSTGASGATPFSLLPLDGSAITATTKAPITSTTSTTAASATTVP